MKRSLTIRGHATSISLEDAFWDELRRIAAAEEVTLPALVARIDAMRWENGAPRHGLSSSLRLYVLESLKREASPRSG